jgi:hypothetical protein
LSFCLEVLRNEMLSWMERKLLQDGDEELEEEEQLRSSVSDALGWVLRDCAGRGDEDARRLRRTYRRKVASILAHEPFKSLFTPDLDDDEDDEGAEVDDADDDDDEED